MITYLPNALGQATQAKGPPPQSGNANYAWRVQYHPNGAVKSFGTANGESHTLTQDLRGLPEHSRDSYNSDTVALLDDWYDYDANGNVAAISDGLSAHRGDRTMTYDDRDRLTDATSPMYGTAGAHYTYDVLENVTHVTAPGRDEAFCFDAAWRLTNIKQTSCTGSTISGLGYDVQGNLANQDGTTAALLGAWRDSINVATVRPVVPAYARRSEYLAERCQAFSEDWTAELMELAIPASNTKN